MVAPQRVGAPAAERGGSRGAQARPSAEAGRGVAEALKQFNSAQEAFDQGKLDEAFALAEPLKNNPDLPEAYRTRLEQLSQKITEAMEAKRKEEAQRQLERLEARQKAEREGKLEEWLEQYGLPPKAYLWAYDLTVEPGRTYRYRCRVVLYNWYLGVVSKLGDRGDAEKTELAGEWSELSEPMLVEPASYFYLSSADSQTKQARVDVFKWHFGQWVKEDFRIGVGEGIGQTRRVRLHETDGQLSARPVEVNFDTGAVAVDIEYDRPSKSLVSRGTGQFDLTSAQSSAALVYVDADGLLQERVATYDAADPTRLKLAQAVRESRTPVRVEPTGPRAPARTPEGRTPRRSPLPGARPGAANRPPAGGGYPGGERKPGE
jgi:hypothetical protein